MSTTTPLWPRTGTHEFRQWIRRFVLIVFLPLAAVALALGSILVATAPAEGGGDAPLGLLWLALVGGGGVGGLAVFHRGEGVGWGFRPCGGVPVNPLSVAVVMVSLGLSG